MWRSKVFYLIEIWLNRLLNPVKWCRFAFFLGVWKLCFLFLSFVACASVVVCGVLLAACGSELGLQPKPGFNRLESRFPTQVFDRLNPSLNLGAIWVDSRFKCQVPHLGPLSCCQIGFPKSWLTLAPRLTLASRIWVVKPRFHNFFLDLHTFKFQPSRPGPGK